MFAKPDVQQIVQVAASLGIRLGDEEAALYQPVLIGQLQEFDEFMQARLDEGRPSLLFPQSAPNRIEAAEDPTFAPPTRDYASDFGNSVRPPSITEDAVSQPPVSPLSAVSGEEERDLDVPTFMRRMKF